MAAYTTDQPQSIFRISSDNNVLANLMSHETFLGNCLAFWCQCTRNINGSGPAPSVSQIHTRFIEFGLPKLASKEVTQRTHNLLSNATGNVNAEPVLITASHEAKDVDRNLIAATRMRICSSPLHSKQWQQEELRSNCHSNLSVRVRTKQSRHHNTKTAIPLAACGQGPKCMCQTRMSTGENLTKGMEPMAGKKADVVPKCSAKYAPKLLWPQLHPSHLVCHSGASTNNNRSPHGISHREARRPRRRLPDSSKGVDCVQDQYGFWQPLTEPATSSARH